MAPAKVGSYGNLINVCIHVEWVISELVCHNNRFLKGCMCQGNGYVIQCHCPPPSTISLLYFTLSSSESFTPFKAVFFFCVCIAI